MGRNSGRRAAFGGGLEGKGADQQAVNKHAKAIDIICGSGRFSFKLLRALLANWRRLCGLIGLELAQSVLDANAQAEVGDARTAIPLNDHVGGRQIAVHQLNAVGIIESVAESRKPRPDVAHVEKVGRPLGEGRFESAPGKGIHRDRRPVVFLNKIVNPENAGVNELPGSFDFMTEDGHSFLILEDGGREEMEGNLFAQDLVLRQPDDALAGSLGASAKQITTGEGLTFAELGDSISGRRGRLHGSDEVALRRVEQRHRGRRSGWGAAVGKGCISASSLNAK